jgi:hypothetical protein
MHQMHDPAYEQIMAMGPRALPYIFDELARNPDHWFKALNYITQQNPVPDSDAGDLDQMARAWLEWGRRHDLWTGLSR